MKTANNKYVQVSQSNYLQICKSLSMALTAKSLSLCKVSHSVSLLVLVPLPGDTRWTGGVSSSLEVKRVEGEIPSRLLSTDPGVRAGKLSGVTGVLKVGDSDDTEGVGEGAWTRVADGAGGIPGSHSVVRVQEDWPEDCGDWGGIQVRGDG